MTRIDDQKWYGDNEKGSLAGCPKIRLLQTYKPDSVPLAQWLSFIWPQHCCCDLAAYPSASDEQSSSADIRGITAPKVYPK